MTPKQTSRALAALTNLQYRVALYAEVAGIRYQPTVWEREALFRLRSSLVNGLPVGDPQLLPPPESAEPVA